MIASKRCFTVLLGGLLLMVAGCQQDDSRVARVAQEAAQRQAEQNKQMAQLQGHVAEGANRAMVAGAASCSVALTTCHSEYCFAVTQ